MILKRSPLKLSDLKLNGILVVATPNICFIDHLKFLVFHGRFPKTSQDRGGYESGHIHYFSFRDIRGLLERFGFSILEERGFDLKGYFSPKVLFFRLFAGWFEKKVEKELFCPVFL